MHKVLPIIMGLTDFFQNNKKEETTRVSKKEAEANRLHPKQLHDNSTGSASRRPWPSELEQPSMSGVPPPRFGSMPKGITARQSRSLRGGVRQRSPSEDSDCGSMDDGDVVFPARGMELGNEHSTADDPASSGDVIASPPKPRVVHVGVKEVERAAGGMEEQPGAVEALQRKNKKLRDELEAERSLRNEAEEQYEQLEPLVKVLRHERDVLVHMVKELRQERDEARKQGQGQVSSSVMAELKAKLEKAVAAKEEAEAQARKAMKENDALQSTEAEARGVAKRWVRTLDLALRSDVEGWPLPVVLSEVLTEVERHCSEGAPEAQAELAEARRVLRTLGVVDDMRGVAHVLQTEHQRWALELSKVQGEKEELLQQVAEARRRAQALAVGSPSLMERSTLADVISTIAQENQEMERQWRREQTRMAQEALDMEQELRRLRADKARVEEEKREQERQKEAERREKAEVLRREEQLRAYALGLEQQAREPPRPAYTTPLYVAFNSEPQHQYEPNVQHIARLLNDPPAEIKSIVRSASELGEGSRGVLLYVTYSPNQRLSVDMERLQTFIGLRDIKVVLVILQRGSNSQPVSVTVTSLGIPLAAILHYGINGQGLEQSHTPAGQMSIQSNEALRHLLCDEASPAEAS